MSKSPRIYYVQYFEGPYERTTPLMTYRGAMRAAKNLSVESLAFILMDETKGHVCYVNGQYDHTDGVML